MSVPYPLYQRLPEIYHIKDAEQEPPYQLRQYVHLVETVYGHLHERIGRLYDDLFIATCDDWVIPYIGDLLGVSHLSGDAWTLRADVADTIAMRRRKGTLAGIERLTYDLTRWGVHAFEMYQNLLWTQHLNHQRPDAGGVPPHVNNDPREPVRGGIVPVRDPAVLSNLGTAFDRFARTPDLRPPSFGRATPNLPHLAVFLWRLAAYRVPFTRPVFRATVNENGLFLVGLYVDPLGGDLQLFNTGRYDPHLEPPVVARPDETPGPIHRARINGTTPGGSPEQYLTVDTWLPGDGEGLDLDETGLQLHLPEPEFTGQAWPGETGTAWRIRGEDLCAWEAGLQVPVENRDILVDPERGRLILVVDSEALANALEENLLVTYTYGWPGPVGAHPIARNQEGDVDQIINLHEAPDSLADAIAAVSGEDPEPYIIEIRDSLSHELDLTAAPGTSVIDDGGAVTISLTRPLIIRAGDGQRPTLLLRQPLAFRADDPQAGAGIDVRIEGLHITRGEDFPADSALITRAAVNRLEIVDSTLDPGGHRLHGGGRADILPSLDLRDGYGFVAEDGFDQVPRIFLWRSVTGPLFIDQGYHLHLSHTIVDGGQSQAGQSDAPLALGNASDVGDWGPPMQFEQITILGASRVFTASGRGGIFTGALQVHNNQTGCIRYSAFSGVDDRLPQNLGCVSHPDAKPFFTHHQNLQPGYCQLHRNSDFRIRERGPGDDAMGAWGFLLEAHKWRNLQIRYREFMPVGIRPLLVPVT